MPTLNELGRRMKQRHPGAYDDLSDLELGTAFKRSDPETFRDFQGSDAQRGIFRTVPREEAIQEAFPTSLMPRPERMGEVGGFVGEIGGAIAGGAIPGGQALRAASRVLGAGLGAGAGVQAERLLRGQPPNLEQGTMEALFAAVPEAGEEIIRAISRGVLRATRGGRQLRSDEAANIAATFAQRTFQPPGQQQAQQLFQLFTRMDVTAPLTPAKTLLDAIEDGPRKRRLLRELRSLDPEGTAALVGGDALSLNRLQEFRSFVGEQAQKVGPRTGGARLQADLRDVRAAIDQAIDLRLEQINIPGAAQTAREAWHRLKASDRLHDLLTTRPVTKIIDEGNALEFSLEPLLNGLKDNRGRRFRLVNRDLNKIPGARTAFLNYLEELKDVLPRGKLEFSDVSGLRRFGVIGALDRMVSEIITSPAGQQLFRRAAVFGRGRMSINTVATIFNIVRRRESGVGTSQRLEGNVTGATTLGQQLLLPQTTPALRPQPQLTTPR